MNNIELVELYLQKRGIDLHDTKPLPLTGWQFVEAVWPLNERFRPVIERIRSLDYDTAFIEEANEAIRRFINHDNSNWDDVSSGAWRVLLERQQQSITAAVGHFELNNIPVTRIPSGLTESQITPVVLLLLLHNMQLPFPIAERSSMTIPAGSAKASLKLH